MYLFLYIEVEGWHNISMYTQTHMHAKLDKPRTSSDARPACRSLCKAFRRLRLLTIGLPSQMSTRSTLLYYTG